MEKVAKKLQNSKKHKFYCETCLYGCSNKTNFNKHKTTYKHLRLTNAASRLTKKLSTDFQCENCQKFFKHRQSLFRHQKICKKDPSQLAKLAKKLAKVSHPKFECVCGKSYKHASSLSKHKLKCILLKDEEENDIIEEIVPTNNVEYLLKNIMMDNKAILEENKELRSEIKNLKIGNNITNNNQQYSINFFLNEKCKNAMNLEDFVERIKFTLEDLEFTKDNGYAKGISNIFIKNLNDMDITERPIHCSDQKRMQFYIKNDNSWSKDKANEKLDHSIEKVSKKQIKSIKEWVMANPNYMDSEVKMSEYFELIKNITQPNDDKNLRTIKKKVGENVKLEKTKVQVDDSAIEIKEQNNNSSKSIE